MEKKQEQYQKIKLIKILPKWLDQLEIGRPSNELFRMKGDKEAEAQYLKLKKDIGLETQTDALHHILPGNQITNMMENCRIQNKVQTCELLTNHCNRHREIRKLIQKAIEDGNFKSAMEFCWSSVFWYRRNLVLGPKEDRRSNDPKNNLDQLLLKQQGGNYQSIMQNCLDAIQFATTKGRKWIQALDYFLKLTPTNNVQWRYQQKIDRWFVGQKSKYPGNAGFNYY